MPKVDGLVVLNCTVHHENVVSVDIDRLKTNYYLLGLSLMVSHDKDARIPNIELVLPFDKEFRFLWVDFTHLEHEEAQPLLILIGEYVEHLILVIVNDFANRCDLVELIDILLFSIEQVDPIAIFSTGCNEHILVIIWLEVGWLPLQDLAESMQRLHLEGLEVETEDFILFTENDGVPAVAKL